MFTIQSQNVEDETGILQCYSTTFQSLLDEAVNTALEDEDVLLQSLLITMHTKTCYAEIHCRSNYLVGQLGRNYLILKKPKTTEVQEILNLDLTIYVGSNRSSASPALNLV